MPASPDVPPPGGVDPAIMAARYGQPPAPQTRRRRLVVTAVLATVLIAAAVLVQAVGLSRPSVSSQDLGFTVDGPTRTTVRFNIITDPGTTVRCSLIALNESFTEVGFRVVVVGPVDARTTSHEAVVTTSEPATTGSVSSCEIVGSG
ncbi:MAG: DUF4307 domain-containing protein [Georgenia sp.]